jgi:hypothetical protein
VVIGQKEIDAGFVEFGKLVRQLAKEVKGKPFIRREWPAKVSRLLS